MLGNHAPRQCGIATFTTDLCDAFNTELPELDCFVLAMNDPGKQYNYPKRVRFEIAESDVASYQRAADFLNVNDIGVLSVQHEYGIFGGKCGSHLITLLRELRMPMVTTLHTILANPSPAQRVVMDELCALSERLVVMSANGAELLRDVHHVSPRKIDLIPHGIPVLPEASRSKDKLGVQGKLVILTFGLLSADKGIEHVIDALPEITRHFPNVIYIVLGATHPHVKEREGETYRLMLENKSRRLGMEQHVIFHNRFVSHTELTQFLAAADIYITPYLNPEQITSGTLAYAVGSGKTVVSTPYRYARELLADGRGVLVPWRDPATIAAEVIGLLGDERRRRELERRAAAFGRGMTWPVVARAYMQSFQRASAEHKGRLRTSFRASTIAKRPTALPDINLSHLRVMTDDTGILQHAAWNVPRYEDGYCVDDNARALIVMTLVEESAIEPPAAIRALATRYIAFLRHAFDAKHGRYRNFMTYDRRWTEPNPSQSAPFGSEDSHGRAVWATGMVVGRSSDYGRRTLATELFHSALRATLDFSSPRAWAYTLLGIDEYLQAIERAKQEHQLLRQQQEHHQDHAGGHVPSSAKMDRMSFDDGDVAETARAVRAELVNKLIDLFRKTSTEAWPWFEDRLTYGNARLSQALIATGAATGNTETIAIGLKSLEWLASIQRTDDDLFDPIGTNGSYVRGKTRAHFDQQPIEACSMVAACLEAHRVTSKKEWVDRARTAFHWFLGQNRLGYWLYDATTGGCRDGLHPSRVNENQGAESTVSFLTALVEMRLADRAIGVEIESRAPTSSSSTVENLERLGRLATSGTQATTPTAHAASEKTA